METPSDRCPDCDAAGRVVTAVTITTLRTDPRMILVTRLCSRSGCHLKYTLSKTEDRLDEEERSRWRLR